VGSSAEGARLVVFWGEQCNWGGGAAALRAERAGGRGMNHTHACRRIHTIKPTVRTVTVERGRVACLRLRAKVTRLCEVAAQGGSPTACLSCREDQFIYKEHVIRISSTNTDRQRATSSRGYVDIQCPLSRLGSTFGTTPICLLHCAAEPHV
jgi:hypothetical protein